MNDKPTGLDSTEDIARHIAAENWTEDQWRAYHPIVKATVEWLQENRYLVIVGEEEE